MFKLADVKADFLSKNDDLIFIRNDKAKRQVQYTEAEYAAASTLWRNDKPSTGAGRPPIRPMFAYWIEKGRPLSNLDDQRKERLAVEQLSDTKWSDLNDDDYAEWVDVWKDQGEWEPLAFVPRGVAAKYVGVKDGKEVILYVESEDLEAYKGRENIRKAGHSAYMGVLGDAAKGVEFRHMVHPGGYVRPTDEEGHPISKAEATKRQADAALRENAKLQKSIMEAYAQRDWAALEPLLGLDTGDQQVHPQEQAS